MTQQPSHLGFARTLISEKRSGGLVHQSTFEPLLCTGCNVEVTGDKFIARVVVSHTFINNFPCVAPASLGFRLDPTWQVTLLRVDTIDGKFTLSQQQVVNEAQDKNKGGLPVAFGSSEHIASTADTISCDLPWDLLSGQTVTSTLEFLVPMDTSAADHAVFALPAFVSCFDPIRALEAENSAASWKGRFTLLSTPVAPSSTSVVPRNGVRIRGQLSVPWSAPNNASASAAKVKVNFNQTSATYKDLATYGSIRFEYELQQPQQTKNPAAGKSDAFTSFIKEGFVATITRPDVVRDATVAIESVTVGFDARAAATERVSVALSIAPNVSHINPNRVFPNVEVIFLVDCSEDCVIQWGSKIQDALSIALRGLAADAMFNIVCYGDAVVRAFDRSRYTIDSALDAAENFVTNAASPVVRGLGKRKLFDALSTVFTEPCVAGYARTVVLLTNGGCDGNQQQDSTRARVIDLVASNSQIATLLTIGLGSTADNALLEAMAKHSAAGSLFRAVSQKYSASFLEIDNELNETAAGFAGIHTSSYAVDAQKVNAVAGTLVQSLASMLRPALASIMVRFVSKQDGSVLPEDKIRLASRLPLTVVDGKRVVIFAVASADVPPCSILVTGLLGTEQQSFTTDFIGGSEAAKLPNNGSAAAGKGGDATSTFDLNYVAAVQARLNLVEVFTIRTTLKDEQAAECRRLAGTVRLPSNATALTTRTEQSAQAWSFGVIHYGWIALARRCNVLAAPKIQPARTHVKTANTVKSAKLQQQQTVDAASSSSPINNKKPVSLLPPLNADADPFAKYTQVSTTESAIRENNGPAAIEHDAQLFADPAVIKPATAVATGDVPTSFIRTQRGDGLWDSKNENVWKNLLARIAKKNPSSSLTIESLRGSAAATNRRPGSASDLAAARWLAALVVASIENHEGSDEFGAAVGAMAVKKARAALRNDDGLITRAVQVLNGSQ